MYNSRMRDARADITVIGGGTGGVAAALAALKMGRTVVLTEETDWIGGQFTSQAVPPDENHWIEQFGGTRSYRELRENIREYYRRWYPLTSEARSNPYLNPGKAGISKIAHEPRVSLAVMEAMLQPYLMAGQLRIWLRHVPAAVSVNANQVQSVLVRDLETGVERTLEAEYFLDATELGELLPLAGVEYVTGAESRRETGEPHAVDGPAQPLNQQSVTHCMALSYHAGEDWTIDRPEQYDFWANYQPDFWPDRLLSWTYPNPRTLGPISRVLLPEDARRRGEDLWPFRRIAARDNVRDGFAASDITIINWPQNDYWLGPIVDVPAEEAARHLEGARQLSLSFLYWMQTAAPRPDGGRGYPGLKPRGDVTGTRDGLAKSVYVREARRIQAEFTVVEQHVSSALRDKGSEVFADSIGIGCYRIDLHPSTAGDNYIDIGAWPFQIPLGSLIPQRIENLLPACKNLGVTHITNGCYRLHPVEWNIGEVAGLLAAHCLDIKDSPRAVRNRAERLKDFQALVQSHGVEIEWPRMWAV